MYHFSPVALAIDPVDLLTRTKYLYFYRSYQIIVVGGSVGVSLPLGTAFALAIAYRR